MRKHLIFLLSGPMASYGDYAGHERRGSGSVPLRSAILGLIGAALGIKRTHADNLSCLNAYSIAVQSFQNSMPLRDYHTVQTIPRAKANRPPTRKNALENAGREANTIITIRDYRCDVLVGATLWGEGKWSLEDIAKSLKRPVFPLYLGRKSCPIANPLNPGIVMASGPVEALKNIKVEHWLCTERWSEEERDRQLVYSDPIEDHEIPTMTMQLPNDPLNRLIWTFGKRTVWLLGTNRCESRGEE